MNLVTREHFAYIVVRVFVQPLAPHSKAPMGMGLAISCHQSTLIRESHNGSTSDTKFEQIQLADNDDDEEKAKKRYRQGLL
jgi:hypothetical protein